MFKLLINALIESYLKWAIIQIIDIRLSITLLLFRDSHYINNL